MYDCFQGSIPALAEPMANSNQLIKPLKTIVFRTKLIRLKIEQTIRGEQLPNDAHTVSPS